MQAANDTNVTHPPILPYPLPLISLPVLVTFSIIYATIGILAVFGNTLIAVSYATNERLHTPTNYFVVSLAGADILVGAVAIPVWLYVLYAHTQSGPTEIMYSLWRILDMLAGIASILHLMIISIERACAIAIPIRHRNVNKKVYKITLLIIWLTALLGSCVTLFAAQWHYTLVFNSVVFFFVPLCVITIAYCIIYKAANEAARKRQRRLNKDMRLAGTILMVIGLFVVAWLPFFISGLIAVYCVGCVYQMEVGLSFKILHYGNSVVNPIIYSIRIPQFRRAFLKLLGCSQSNNGTIDGSITYAKNTLPKYSMVVNAPGKEMMSSSDREECLQVETVL